MDFVKPFEKWDRLNFFIIFHIYEAALKGKVITTWDIAKDFEWEDNGSLSSKTNSNFYHKKSVLVRYKILRMAEEGIIEKTLSCNRHKKRPAYEFKLNDDKVVIGKLKFPNRKRKSDTIFIKQKDNKWQAMEI